MRVLLTTDLWRPTVNGVVRSVELLRQELNAQGHDVRVLTLSQSHQSYEEDGVTYLASMDAGRVYPGVRVRLARGAGRWLQKLADWQPEVVHSQCEFSTFLPAYHLAQRCGCPLVHTYHTVYEDYVGYLHLGKRVGRTAVVQFTLWAARRCNAMIAPTEKVRMLLTGYGVQCPVAVVPTGIDLHAFHPVQDGGADRTELRQKLGIPLQETMLLSLGRIAAEKEPGMLLDLLAAQPAAERPWLVFVGDGPARAGLEEQTRALGLSDRVRFAGMVSPEDVPRWYRAADAFVCASRSETQGLTYFEAMACGLPLLCRADPCLDGVVTDGRNGWLWRDEAEFSAALSALRAGGAAGWAALSQGSVDTAARWSSEQFVRNVVEVYQQAMTAVPRNVRPESTGGGWF